MRDLNHNLLQEVANNVFNEKLLSLKVGEDQADLLNSLAEALEKNNVIREFRLECRLNNTSNSDTENHFNRFASTLPLRERLFNVLNRNRTISLMELKFVYGHHWLQESYGQLRNSG